MQTAALIKVGFILQQVHSSGKKKEKKKNTKK